MNKISVIVPVYNTEKYLNKCINSLLRQTYKNIEIILIDDGSTDSSGSICDEYAQNYANIQVRHIENGGQGRARNIGVSLAGGEYIMFCDSDDYYDSDMVEYLYNSIKDTPNIKIAMCGLKFLFGYKTLNRIVYEKPFVADFDKIISLYFNENKIISSPVNKIYHKSVFEKLKYPEDMIYEDRYISLPMFIQFPEIYMCGEAKYNYVIRQNSTIQSSFSDKNLDYLKVLEQEKILLSEYPQFDKQIIYSYNDGIEFLLRKIISGGYSKNKEAYNRLLEKLKENTEQNKQIFDNSNFKKWQKFYKYKHIAIWSYSFRNYVGKIIHKLQMITKNSVESVMTEEGK